MASENSTPINAGVYHKPKLTQSVSGQSGVKGSYWIPNGNEEFSDQPAFKQQDIKFGSEQKGALASSASPELGSGQSKAEAIPQDQEFSTKKDSNLQVDAKNSEKLSNRLSNEPFPASEARQYLQDTVRDSRAFLVQANFKNLESNAPNPIFTNKARNPASKKTANSTSKELVIPINPDIKKSIKLSELEKEIDVKNFNSSSDLINDVHVLAMNARQAKQRYQEKQNKLFDKKIESNSHQTDYSNKIIERTSKDSSFEEFQNKKEDSSKQSRDDFGRKADIVLNEAFQSVNSTSFSESIIDTQTGKSLPSETVEAFFRQMERFRTSNKDTFRFTLSLPDGSGTVQVKLKMQGDQVKVNLSSESPGLLKLIKEGWENIFGLARRNGIDLATPIFENK